jgi:hypothetical protein
MYVDLKVRLSNKLWARHLEDAVAMWLERNSVGDGSQDRSGDR